MWLESLLFHTLPAPVGAFMERHTMPFIGAQALHPRKGRVLVKPVTRAALLQLQEAALPPRCVWELEGVLLRCAGQAPWWQTWATPSTSPRPAAHPRCVLLASMPSYTLAWARGVDDQFMWLPGGLLMLRAIPPPEVLCCPSRR